MDKVQYIKTSMLDGVLNIKLEYFEVEKFFSSFEESVFYVVKNDNVVKKHFEFFDPAKIFSWTSSFIHRKNLRRSADSIIAHPDLIKVFSEEPTVAKRANLFGIEAMPKSKILFCVLGGRERDLNFDKLIIEKDLHKWVVVDPLLDKYCCIATQEDFL